MQGITGMAAPTEWAPCDHDSMRVDGLLDNCCLRCGAVGYWLDGQRIDVGHPSGKVLIRPVAA